MQKRIRNRKKRDAIMRQTWWVTFKWQKHTLLKEKKGVRHSLLWNLVKAQYLPLLSKKKKESNRTVDTLMHQQRKTLRLKINGFSSKNNSHFPDHTQRYRIPKPILMQFVLIWQPNTEDFFFIIIPYKCWSAQDESRIVEKTLLRYSKVYFCTKQGCVVN